ncbi:MAG: TRAP transporter substrate-binding protein DctP [Chloroflexota bacterium]|nr:TRAP transporter substrate-binding protein DctP [Chloroflexota bacterium]
MGKFGLLYKIAILCLFLLLAVTPAIACTQKAPAPSPVPAPTPAPAPAPAPKPAPAPTTPVKDEMKTPWTFHLSHFRHNTVNSLMFEKGGRFWQMLDAATEGRFKYEIKEPMFPMAQVVFAIQDGRVQWGTLNTAFHAGTYPLWDIGGMPFYWKDVYEYERFELDPKVQAIWDRTYRKAGLVKLLPNTFGADDALFANKKIETADGLKGLKIRAAGIFMEKGLKALGASVVTISDVEVEQALIRGTVDALQTAPGVGTKRWLPSIIKYINFWNVTSIFESPVLVNAKAFDELPPDLKDALLKVSREIAKQATYASEVGRGETLNALRNVCEFVYPSEAEIKKAIGSTTSVIRDWEKLSGADGTELISIAAKYASGHR